MTHNKSGVQRYRILIVYNQVISDHILFLKDELNLEVNGENKKHPNLWLAPKLQRYTSKVRFMIAAPQCSIKPLPKAVTAVLNL